MHLSVYSLKRVLFDGQARRITCGTTAGQVTVLANHEPYLAELTAGELQVLDERAQLQQFPIASGVIEVERGSKVRCLVDEE